MGASCNTGFVHWSITLPLQMYPVLHAHNWHSKNHIFITIYPERIFSSKNNHRRLSPTSNWRHNCNNKIHPEVTSFFPLWWCQKNVINQISHILQRSTAQPRIQILPLPSLLPQIHNENFQPAEITIIPAPAPKVESFFNLQGCKHKSQHSHRLQEIGLTHILAWIISHDSKHLQNIRSYPRFSKPGKHKRHPSKFNTVYAVPHATLGKKYAPKQHSKLLPTIYSNYHMLYISTISRVKRKL